MWDCARARGGTCAPTPTDTEAICRNILWTVTVRFKGAVDGNRTRNKVLFALSHTRSLSLALSVLLTLSSYLSLSPSLSRGGNESLTRANKSVNTDALLPSTRVIVRQESNSYFSAALFSKEEEFYSSATRIVNAANVASFLIPIYIPVILSPVIPVYFNLETFS